MSAGGNAHIVPLSYYSASPDFQHRTRLHAGFQRACPLVVLRMGFLGEGKYEIPSPKRLFGYCLSVQKVPRRRHDQPADSGEVKKKIKIASRGGNPSLPSPVVAGASAEAPEPDGARPTRGTSSPCISPPVCDADERVILAFKSSQSNPQLRHRGTRIATPVCALVRNDRFWVRA